MASKRHLWYSNLVLATLEMSVDLIIGYVMANSHYMHKLGYLSHPHGLEEAPVVHKPNPGVC